MKQILVKTSNQNYNYPIYIGKNILGILPKILKFKFKKVKKISLIIDSNVPKKFEKNLKRQLKNYQILIIKKKFNEKNKSLFTVNFLLEKLIKNKFSRSDIVICMGGGVAGDVSSLAASLFKRGLNFINIPTTLLAQNDSSIGGKTGINTSQGKNIIGTFYQPKLVLIDIEFLKSLPKREILCGYAEILKHSIIHDRNFFRWLEINTRKILNLDSDNILIQSITKSLKVKQYYVSKDTNENNLRMKLNFGHTFAHAIEAKNNYSGKINHGESVLIGMILAVKLSLLKGMCSQVTADKIFNLYLKNDIKFKINKVIKKKEISKIISLMQNDKKNNDNKINLILLKSIGKTTEPDKFKMDSQELKKKFYKLIDFDF